MTEEQQQAAGGASPVGRGRRLPRGVLRLAAAVVVAGALVGAAGAVPGTLGTGPADEAGTTGGPGEGAAFVRSASLACPGWPAEEGVRAQTVRVRAATSPPRVGAPSQVGDGATLTGPEQGTGVRFPGGGGPDELDPGSGWAAVAAGPDAAPGLVAAQLAASPGPDGRGLSVTPCAAPQEVVHLLAGGAGAGQVEQVVVTNPGADPVRVSLEVVDVDGPVQAAGARGRVVPARGRTSYLLDALAPGLTAPAVTVVAEGGPVTAHLLERRSEGSVALGTAAVPAAAEPGRSLVVPALPAPGEGDGERTLTLRLLAPQEEAVVELRALTTSGARTPERPVARVPAGSTLDVDLGDLADDVVGLLLRSDAPVTAAAHLHVAPSSDEPVVVEESAPATADDDAAVTAAPPDEAARTGDPDDAATTAGPDDAATTGDPDDAAATTAGPDDAATTADPDDQAATAGPGDRPRVLRPAGESAWVTAVALADTPVGIAVPEVAAVLPAGGDDATTTAPASLAVSAVDATTARVHWMDGRGAVTTQELTLPNDTSEVLEVPDGTAAVWVVPTGAGGVAAALHLRAADRLGPYVGAATLPAVPWTREVTRVVPVVP